MFFNLFRKKKKDTEHQGVDFSTVGADMHSHLIPGIDDGAQTMEESIILIKRMMDFGFKKVITTPHVMADYYRNTSDGIRRGLDGVREELQKQQVEIEIDAAAEYYLDETLENKIRKGDILLIGGKFLLFELSFVNYPQNLMDTISKIKDKGYTPLLAHPERYSYLASDIENYHRIKNAGCYLQLNTTSLTGFYGKTAQKAAEELVDAFLIDFIGTDLHKMKHVQMLDHALRLPYVHKLLSNYPLQNQML
ncbi:tyrosine-protein phosphatase [Pedobacter sp. SYSU D00535]|uniref:tyrosine-protein phosphatase n=1 Tax=Pedobacter sp. SYSU D00535 TaxID=2810308 RepID=UPI001A96CE32|nr:CpsB/CapC family capsule biosynthesis tyrosine phosphatase [Pedobacter sp. SYSU D00535]